MSDIVRDPYGNPLSRDKLITTLRAEVEKLRALVVKSDEAIARQQQDLEEAADRAADCDILRAENEKLRQVLENTQQARVLQGKAITDASNEIERLRAALSGVLWMAEEWFKHGGDETTFADDYEAKLEAARAEVKRMKEQLESPFVDGYETAKEEYRPRLIAAEAENEKLRAALKPFANLTIKGDEPDVWAKKFPRFIELITTARAALEEKQ